MSALASVQVPNCCELVPDSACRAASCYCGLSLAAAARALSPCGMGAGGSSNTAGANEQQKFERSLRAEGGDDAHTIFV